MAAAQGNGRAVVVTGTSSGIGRQIATYLSRMGFLVFATMRNPATAQEIKSLDEPNLVPIAPLDLSDPDQIERAVETITSEVQAKGLDGIYAVISNAGGGVTAPLELLDMDALDGELKTRVVGPARLIQGLLPLIRSAHGRLLWITTPALVLLPFKSSIHIAEFATQALARSFGMELSPWDIPSVLIGCGGIKTNAVSRMDQQLNDDLNTWPQEKLSLYQSSLDQVLERSKDIRSNGADPQKVAEIVSKALLADKPKRTYRVGASVFFMVLMGLLPWTAVDKLFAAANRGEH